MAPDLRSYVLKKAKEDMESDATRQELRGTNPVGVEGGEHKTVGPKKPGPKRSAKLEATGGGAGQM